MTPQSQSKRITVPEVKARKGREPVVCLTCYHAHTARLLDTHVDLMLVGDTLGMVIHGMETTNAARNASKRGIALKAESWIEVRI